MKLETSKSKCCWKICKFLDMQTFLNQESYLTHYRPMKFKSNLIRWRPWKTIIFFLKKKIISVHVCPCFFIHVLLHALLTATWRRGYHVAMTKPEMECVEELGPQHFHVNRLYHYWHPLRCWSAHVLSLEQKTLGHFNISFMYACRCRDT